MLEDILANGGLVLWAIGLASLVALAVGLERTWRLLELQRRCRESHQRYLEADGSPAASRAALADGDDPMARCILGALAHAGHGPEAVRSAGLDRVQWEVGGIERGLGVLATVAQITPLLGLFGTVLGLMLAFQESNTDEMVTAATLAGGIYKALGTTAAGLGVAIPTTLAYNALAALAGRIVDDLERVACECPVRLDEAQA